MVMVSFVWLFVCLSVSFAHREDRLANTDELEHMLQGLMHQQDHRSIENSAGRRKGLLGDEPDDLSEGQTTATKDLTETTTGRDALDELSAVIERLRDMNRLNNQHSLPSTKDPVATTTRQVTQSNQSPDDTTLTPSTSSAASPSQSSRRDYIMEKIRTLLENIYEDEENDLRSTPELKTSSPTTTTQPTTVASTTTRQTTVKLKKDKFPTDQISQELQMVRKEALDLASRALLLYLRLRQNDFA